MIKLFEKQISIRKRPVNLKEEENHIFAHELEKEIRASHILELENVYIIKDTIFSLKGMKLYETYAQVKKRPSHKYLRNFYLFLTRPQSFDKAVWIIDDWCSNYFHWITDALPRLVNAEKYLTPDHVLLLPERYRDLTFVKDSLSFFKIPVAYFKTSSIVKVRKLLLPSHTSDTGNYNSVLINKIRDQFLLKDRNPERKIFISRKKAGRRQILNEDMVQRAMAECGFEIHYFEDYSFQQQIEIMAETKYLVSLHGAGLTNIIFMGKKSRLLELRNAEDSHNNCYFSLASEMDIDYYYQMNQGDSDHTTTVNVTVDVEALKKNVALMMA